MLENVTLDTKRGSKLSGSAQSTAPDTYLEGVIANLRPMTAQDYVGLPTEALKSNYILTIDPALNEGNTDFGENDTLINIVRLDNGCLYDDTVPPPGQENSASVIWRVKYAPETRVGPALTHRVVYILRGQGTGPGYRGY